jgi:hypothetical protein
MLFGGGFGPEQVAHLGEFVLVEISAGRTLIATVLLFFGWVKQISVSPRDAVKCQTENRQQQRRDIRSRESRVEKRISPQLTDA